MTKLSKRNSYAIRESGWLRMDGGWKFLFGGPAALAREFAAKGWIDDGGFTETGAKLRDEHGRGRAELLDRVPEVVEVGK